MNETLREEIIKRAVERRLPCAVARKIAEDLDISYSEVGAAADELAIKIENCQLGCF